MIISSSCGIFRNGSCWLIFLAIILTGLNAQKFSLKLSAKQNVTYRSQWSRFSWCEAADFTFLQQLPLTTRHPHMTYLSRLLLTSTTTPRLDIDVDADETNELHVTGDETIITFNLTPMLVWNVMFSRLFFALSFSLCFGTSLKIITFIDKV